MNEHSFRWKRRAVLIFVFVLIAAVCLAAQPVILMITRGRIQDTFPGSRVTVGGCSLHPLKRLTFRGVSIQRDTVYDFQIDEIEARFHWPALLWGHLSKITVKNARIQIHQPKSNISDFRKSMRSGSGRAVVIDALEADHITLDVIAKDLKADGKLSVTYSPVHPEDNAVDVHMRSVESSGLKITNALVRAAAGRAQGELAVEEIHYDKAKIGDIDGIVRLDGPTVFVDFLSDKTFGGRLEGHVSLSMDIEPEYSADLKFTGLDADRFVRDFDLEEKFTMSGELSGEVLLSGKGMDVRVLSGDLSASEQGGLLVIRDTRFLEDIARRTGQPVNILVENFKNYHYNNGVVRLSMEDKNVLLDVMLDGDTGKRNFTVVAHDFLSNKTQETRNKQ